MVISTWFYAEPPGEESFYSQVGGISSSSEFQEVYWRCITVFFATSKRNNPQARHVLFSNSLEIQAVDGINIAHFLEQLGVEIIHVPFSFKPPEGYYGAWRNQFYIFDILKALARTESDESVCILDSDCVWIDSFLQLENAIQKSEILTYSYNYPPNWNINGLTRYQMKELYSELLGTPLSFLPIYCGGEIFAATSKGIKRVCDDIELLWQEQLRRHQEGLLKCNEEAHALTYLYYSYNLPLGTANPFIKRIWTGLPGKYHSDLPEDYGLTIWHLPTEKRRGFVRLFSQVTNKDSPFWMIPLGPEFANYLGRFLGVNHRSIGNTLRNLTEVATRKLSKVTGTTY